VEQKNRLCFPRLSTIGSLGYEGNPSRQIPLKSPIIAAEILSYFDAA